MNTLFSEKKRRQHIQAVLLASLAFAAATPVCAAAADTQTVLTPAEDYSSYAEPLVDQDGFLHLTDNHTVEDVSSVHLSLRSFRFTIPGAWAGNTVIRTQYLNQTKNDELYKRQLRDCYIIRFYEKATWTKYRSDEWKSQENASRMGELCELRIINNSENDTDTWDQNPLYLHFGSAESTDGQAYELYLYHPKTSDGLIDDEYAAAGQYLTDIDYRGCIISSFTCEDGMSLTLPASYIRYHFVDAFQADGEGIPEGSVIPENYVPDLPRAAKNQTDTMPETLNSVSETTETGYAWTSFTSPWAYVDRGVNFSLSVTPTPEVTSEPVPTDTPNVTVTPEPSGELPDDSSDDDSSHQNPSLPTNPTEPDDPADGAETGGE